MRMDRGSGIIMHITSLPGKYGIGTFGKEAYKFCDFLKKSGQKYWQILPLGPTSYGDSPYQSFSAFAGNPYLIDFDMLQEEKLLKDEDYKDRNFSNNPEVIDYGLMFTEKMNVLKISFDNFSKEIHEDFEKFKEQEKDWLDDYSLFMSIKYKLNFKPLNTWDKKLKIRDNDEIIKYKYELKEEIEYWKYLQYEFFKQWNKLKEYANKNEINIIGDIPIYVAEDSSDVWSNPKVFLLDKNTLNPISVAGCPPDAFSEDGQLWGNPVYNWQYLYETQYEWWVKRIKQSLRLYDVLRLDHFCGFESFWAVPNGEKTARNGTWLKGPGMKLFDVLNKQFKNLKIIAEDLGFLTKETIELKEKTGFPGMKVLEFAFDGDSKNIYLPHNYKNNCVAYTGTHDNDTVRGWIETTGNKEHVENAKEYLNLTKEEGYNWGIIRGVWSSVADISIGLMQDFLNLGNEARMNMPSTLNNNWSWRAKDDVFTDELANKIYRMTKIYGRCE